MSKLIKCKTCLADIAASAKKCPNCGAKNKKPFYTKWWFWAIIIVVAIGLASGNSDNNSKSTAVDNSKTVADNTTKQNAEYANQDEAKAEKLLTDAKNRFEKLDYAGMLSKTQEILDKYPNTQAAANIPSFIEELHATAVQTTGIQIYKDYQENEIAADAKYKDKMVIITGKIDNIGKDITDEPYITLENGEKYAISHAQCYFKDKGQIEKASQLQKGQSVKIIGKGSGAFGNYFIKDCFILE